MKILYLSDFDALGSGYKILGIPLCTGLAERGYEVKVLGLEYDGKEHNHPFSMIPCRDFRDASGYAVNLHRMWHPDVFVVALDVPSQPYFYDSVKAEGGKYIAITPLENGPLTISWAASLMPFDTVFC